MLNERGKLPAAGGATGMLLIEGQGTQYGAQQSEHQHGGVVPPENMQPGTHRDNSAAA